MSMKTLDDLFVHFLRDIYFAEKQILKTLPKMARKADSKTCAKPSRTIIPKPKAISKLLRRFSS